MWERTDRTGKQKKIAMQKHNGQVCFFYHCAWRMPVEPVIAGALANAARLGWYM
jgi:hypothetical protein